MNTYKEKQKLCAKRRKSLIERCTLAELHTMKLLNERGFNILRISNKDILTMKRHINYE